jgi:hypothetical protein
MMGIMRKRTDDADDTGWSTDEVEHTLLKMVDEGELCFGYLPDRGEFGFWACEAAPEVACGGPSSPRASQVPVWKRLTEPVLPNILGSVSPGTMGP